MQEGRKAGFWKRQFTGESTSRQTGYDVIFGILMPVFCLVADPGVFRGYDFVLTHYRWLAYTFFGVEMLVLTLWLLYRNRVGDRALLFAGPLLGGGLFALALHAFMLPLTLVGMLFLIGFLGFTPLLTSLVYFRNAFRAAMACRWRLSWGSKVGVLLAGMAVAALPSLLVLEVCYHESFREFVDSVVMHRVRWRNGDPLH